MIDIQLKNLNVSIVAAIACKPSTIYSINIENISTKQNWCVRRCYSDFFSLRASFVDLLKDIDDIDIKYPKVFFRFPSRSIFGSRRKSIVQYRVVALQEFLRSALNCSMDDEIYNKSIKNLLSDKMKIFLSCVNPLSYQSNNKQSITLLTGIVLNNDVTLSKDSNLNSLKNNNNNCNSTNCKIADLKNNDTWTIAGDAVGLWAATGGNDDHENINQNDSFKSKIESNDNNPFVQGIEPMVYHEMLI